MHRRRIDVDGVELSADAAATTPPRRGPRARSASQDGAALGKMSPRRRRAAAATAASQGARSPSSRASPRAIFATFAGGW